MSIVLRSLPIALLVFCVAALALFCSGDVYAADGVTSSEALAACQASRASFVSEGYTNVSGCDDLALSAYFSASNTVKGGYYYCLVGGEPVAGSDGKLHCLSDIYTSFTWVTNDVTPTCNAGTLVAPGTVVQNYSDKSKCSSGCSLSLVLGDQIKPDGTVLKSGSFVMSGEQCPSSGTSTNASLTTPVVSETANADGTKTYCDPVSGKCVTSGVPTAPAPASSSGNHSTDSTGQVSNPATSSSSTSTGTYSGDGSGGAGSGSGTGGGGTVVTHTQTDSPASASSVSSSCTTGVCDVGQADGQVGSLYEPGTDTPESVFQSFKAKVSQSSLITAASGFFTVNASGSCPTWHIPGNIYWGEAGFDFAFFCQSDMLAIFNFAGYLVLAVAAFSAFRIAIY